MTIQQDVPSVSSEEVRTSRIHIQLDTVEIIQQYLSIVKDTIY